MGKYDYVTLDTNNPKDPLVFIMKNISDSSLVLEFGSAAGRFTKCLKENLSCKVDIVEIDECSGQIAAAYARHSLIGQVHGDIEQFYWLEKLMDQRYDYIVFADVLEHLRNPEKVLENCKSILKEDGSIFISIPNVTHNSIILELMNDDFRYTSTGLLDDTHIHLFAYKSALRAFTQSGYDIVTEKRILRNVGEIEIDASYDVVDKDVARSLKNREHGLVYQYVFELKKNMSGIPRKLERHFDNELESLYKLKCFVKEKEDYQTIIKNAYPDDNCISVQLDEFNDISSVIIELFSENCVIQIKEVFVETEKEKKLLNYKVLNGIRLYENLYLFDECPRIELEDVVAGCSSKIELNYKVVLYESEVLKKIYPLIAERDNVIAERDNVIAERDNVIAERDNVIAERDNVIAERDNVIAERDAVIAEKIAMENTRGWRLLEKIRKLTR